ncbi:MAG: hypothetical protein FWE20_12030 [Defluviitaleaceae bacterium]|nr:hypothetical protein [Defluviitaleaceae bacterium]
MYSYDSAIDLLIKSFPALEPVYLENIYDFEGLPYVFYESIFVKYIMEKICLSDEMSLCTIINFIEDVLQNGDDEIRNLVEVSVIESLYFEEDFRKKQVCLGKFFGKLTFQSFSLVR